MFSSKSKFNNTGITKLKINITYRYADITITCKIIRYEND